jgi:NTE family protein
MQSATENRHPLHLSIILNQLDNLKELIKQGTDINAQDDSFTTPLQMAAIVRNLSAMSLLITAGAKLDFANTSMTPLQICAFNGFVEGLELLISSGSDVNIVDKAGCSALHYAAVKGPLDAVKRLVSAKSLVQLRDFAGRTPLQDAVRFQQLEIVHYFLMHYRFDLNDQDGFGYTAEMVSTGLTKQYLTFYLRCLKGNLTIAEMEEEIKHNSELTPFMVEILIRFARINNIPLNKLKYMVSKNSRNHGIVTFCRAAIRSENIECIKKFVELLSENERNNMDGTKRNILHVAAEMNGHIVVDDCLKTWWISALQESNDNCLTPTHIAAMAGSFQFIETLYGSLSLALRSKMFSARTSSEQTILHLLAASDNVSILKFISKNENEQIFQKLLVAKDAYGNTVIHECVEKNAVKLLEGLLGFPAIVQLIENDIKNNAGLTPQHIAAQKGNCEIMEKLRVANPNFNMPDNTGNTPLHLAVISQKTNIIQYLVKMISVNAHVENFDKKKPYQLADEKQLYSIKNILLHVPKEDKNYWEVIDNLQGYKPISNIQAKPLERQFLTFEGGGIKGSAYGNSIRELIRLKIIDLDKITHVAGTSAGAISALILSMGYSAEEGVTILNSLNFQELIEPRYRDLIFAVKNENYSDALGEDLYHLIHHMLSKDCNGFEKFASFTSRFIPAIKDARKCISSMQDMLKTLNKEFGLFSGELLLTKFAKWVEAKTGNKNITFKELEEKAESGQRSNSNQTFKRLYVVGYSLDSKEKIKIFSAEHTPNDVIIDAVRISIAIPILFKAHQRKEKINDNTYRTIPGLLIDGGIAWNNPYTIFDNAKYFSKPPIDKQMFNPGVVSFRLVSTKNPIMDNTPNLFSQLEQSKIFQHLTSLIKIILSVEDAHFYLNGENQSRTVVIKTGMIGSFDFDLDAKKQAFLATAGEKAARKFATKVKDPISIFSDNADVHYQIKMIFSNYVDRQFLPILFNNSLEDLCRVDDKMLAHEDILLIFQLASISGLTYEIFKAIIFYFKLNVCHVDTEDNTAAHLHAKSGNLEGLKKLDYVKSNIWLMKNKQMLTPIAIFHKYKPSEYNELRAHCILKRKPEFDVEIENIERSTAPT